VPAVGQLIESFPDSPLDKPDQPRVIPEPAAIFLTVSASSVTAG